MDPVTFLRKHDGMAITPADTHTLQTEIHSMCGRFCIAADPGEISERYMVAVPPAYTPRYNISPGQAVLTISLCGNDRRAGMAEWGITTGSTNRIINARIETIHEKPFFKDLYSGSRCLVPASGYYEWKQEKRTKVPYYFSSRSDSLLALAGIIRNSTGDPRLAILTTRAPAPFSDVHDRMPVILGSGCDIMYLKEGSVTPYLDIVMHEVSARVNDAGNDGPDLIVPTRNRPVQTTLDW
jgi:putative SOS response-associated peptidase YedK